MKIYIVVTDVVNDVTYSRKSVITRVVIRFLMTLSTGKQRRHMINKFIRETVYCITYDTREQFLIQHVRLFKYSNYSK